MSLLSYNGIVLQVCRFLNGCERTPIFDGPQYLFTRWRLVCRCLYNPQATTYDFPVRADAGGGPIVSPNVPAQTDQMIRHRLLIPRKQLILGVGRVAWLVSPQQGFTVDSANGPMPLSCAVMKGPGGRSFVVDYAIETKLRECNLETATYPSIFLSHRWEMRHSMDGDGFFTDRIIRGHVIFDTARLAQANVVPDQYRGTFFHPIPPNFQRMGVTVSQHPDGHSVEYEIRDEEQEINIGPAARIFNVTSISGYHTSSINAMSVQDMQMAIGGVVGEIFGGVGTGIGVAASMLYGSSKNLTRRQRLDAAKLGAAIGTVRGLAGLSQTRWGAQNIRDTFAPIPTATHELAVTVQGNAFSSKPGLQATAMRIIDNRTQALFLAIGGLTQAGRESSITYDLKGRSVTVALRLTLGPRASKRAGNTFNQRYPKQVFSDVVGDDLTERNDINPVPPGDSLSRGSFLEYLVAQALSDPCSNQPAPQASPAAFAGVNFGQLQVQ